MEAPAERPRPIPTDDLAQSPHPHARFLIAVVVVAAAGLWVAQLPSSFRADETVTHWITSDGVGDTMRRSLEFEGESPLYFLVQYGVRHVFGSSEVALRMPSFLAMVGAAVLLWRLGRRLVDDDYGAIAALILVASPGITFAAGDARPYPFAVLGVVASTLALVRWNESGRRPDAIAYVLVTALAIYFHYFVLFSLVLHPFYVWRRRGSIRPRAYIGAMVGTGLLLIPIVPHFLALFRRRGSLQVPLAVSANDYFVVLVPAVLVGSMILGALVARNRDRIELRTFRMARGGQILSLAWWIVPPTILYGLTRLTSTTLFEPRYFFFSLPGLALAGAALVRLLHPLRARRVVAAAIAIGALIGFGARNHAGEDWRAIAQAERTFAKQDTPVLLYPSFIESAQIEWLSRPDKAEYLLSMLSPYPMKGRIIPLPYAITPASERYLGRILEETLIPSRRFLVINDRVGFPLWLQGRLAGFRTRSIAGGSTVGLVVFEKSG